MPSVARSKKWFVRVDGPQEHLRTKLHDVLGWIDTCALLGAYHVGDKKENPHCHFVIEMSTELQKQSFDTRIKKLFDVQNRSQFSSKPWDGADGACSYLFHEAESVVLVNKGFPDERIQQFKKLNEDVQKVVQINRERGGKRVVEKLLDEFDSTCTRGTIGRRLLEMIRDGEMYDNGDYKLRNMIEEIYLKTRTKNQWDAYVSDRLCTVLKDSNY